ncbi:murein hydrolase activator EnvC family protein [Bordetella genomosp. 12]|uniref:Peptidase n=1 Tax=Bordetella genomosp. 12 TaxID=463035 RepID=A0A261VDE1_9BORD|nr:peptidoglycan DD-metalloendopeptidase family protein [Bordetella genomosp. 12]OZI72015.1 peptidase [Bordetella genomosp. 12]
MRFAAGLLGLAVAAWVPQAAQAASGDLASRQTEAERQQAALRNRIDSLQKTIDEREAARKEAADALKESESAISTINRRLRELADSTRLAEGDLASLEKQIASQTEVLHQRRTQLAGQLQAQYTSGLSPWTELLSGGDPQELGRNLGYLEYVSRARTQAVTEVRQDIDRLNALQKRADARRAELQQLTAETANEKSALVAQQKERATLLAKLEGQIEAQRAEANRLGRDDQRLTHLIDDLGTAIAKQAEEEARRRAEEARRKAEEARRLEAARKAEEARRAEQARKAEESRRAEAARKARQAEADSRRSQDAQEAARVREQAEAAIERDRRAAVVADPDSAGLKPAEGAHPRLVESREPVATKPVQPSRQEADKPVSEPQTAPARTAQAAQEEARPLVGGGNGLRRGLPPPVRGQVQGRFGVSRPDGGVWRGIVLRAPEGTAVKSVAPGTVVYAEWLRGFGNLIIVDHGQQYLTVYAYNQSLLKRVGDRVATGDTIATVGATGGQVESGLYFEIRHSGAPVDPAQWLAQ